MPVRHVKLKPGDRVVCTGTSVGRYEKGQLGTVEGVEEYQLKVILEGAQDAIMIGKACVEHADGIEWELREGSEGRSSSANGRQRSARQKPPTAVARDPNLEELLQELFKLHDLNGNGVLEEQELVKLNEKIAMLHLGSDTDKKPVREKYAALFRELDPFGEPVVYPIYREYMLRYVETIDPDPRAQVMILEQFVEEAKSGRQAFGIMSMCSESDYPFMPRVAS